MPRRSHPLLLEQAIQKFCLPEQNLDEIESHLRSEQDKNESLALRIAEAQRRPKGASLISELLRQKQNSDLKIEALEFARSKRAFLEGLQESRQQKRRAKRRQTMKRSRTAKKLQPGKTSRSGPRTQKAAVNPNDDVDTRRNLLNIYKEECKDRGLKVTNAMIAAKAGWKDRTAVQRWLRSDPRSTSGDDAKIRRVLREKPHLKKR